MHKKISVIIPAYNEEKFITKTIQNINEVLTELNLTYEIIVSNNNSTDKTPEIAEDLGCKVYLQPVRNIGKTRNFGASHATGDLLLFLDADTKISVKLVKDAINSINNGHKVVSAISNFDKYNTIISYGVWIYNLLSYGFKLGTGQFILISKSDFDSLNGFDEDIYGFEDIHFFKRAKNEFSANKVKILFTPVTTSGRKFNKGKDQFTFVFQLFGVLLNKPIGRTKSNLEFWYGKQDTKQTTYKNYVLIIIALMFFFDNFFGSSLGVINDYKNLSTLLLFIGLSSLIFELKPFVIITLVSLITEIIGESTGFPFGRYQYNEYYSTYGILDVPLFIPLAWYLLITVNGKLFNNPLKTGFSILLIDIFLEKFAEVNNIWKWQTPYLITAPLSNYLTWFLMSVLLYYFVKKSKASLFYSTAILMILCNYIGVNLMANNIPYGIILIIYSLFIFGYAVNKKINSFV